MSIFFIDFCTRDSIILFRGLFVEPFEIFQDDIIYLVLHIFYNSPLHLNMRMGRNWTKGVIRKKWVIREK